MSASNTPFYLPKNIFITGTDTEVGKTYVTKQLLTHFNELGLETMGLKPIASDAELVNGKLKNIDALTLQQAASIKLPYDKINPYCFEPAIAPHIAAKQVNTKLSVANLAATIRETMTNSAHDICLIEGAGGWHVPLNESELFSDLVIKLKLPVILVVGIKLGCINHALLTAEAIRQSGCELTGWVANCLHRQTAYIEENIKSIKQNINSPLLSIVNHSGRINSLAIDTATMTA